MLYSLENSSHFAAGSMAEVQVRLLYCLSFTHVRCTATTGNPSSLSDNRDVTLAV